MTLQNRVDPAGVLHASPARGTLMGNRGCLHDDQRSIVRTASTKRWIACTLEPVFGKRKQLMQPGRYTELFFLDEFTALAAGHRPCAQCRRAEYREFVGAWRRAGLAVPIVSSIANAIDAVLDAERRIGTRSMVKASDMPDGAMVRDSAGEFYLVKDGELLPWSFSGYGAVVQPNTADVFELLTPPSIVQVLRSGYAARASA